VSADLTFCRRVAAGAVLGLLGAIFLLPGPLSAATIDHVYDDDGRLTGSTYSDGQAASYGLDDSGNITSFNASGALAALMHEIAASAASGGSLTPSGAVQVAHGQTQSFSIMPTFGYKRAYLLVDGALAEMGPAYSFSNVTRDHAIKAGFVSMTDDTDNDFLSDAWEMASFSTLARNGTGDYDGDGLTDASEQALATSPAKRDTDGDGQDDAWEAVYGLNPLVNDAYGDLDGDGYSNIQEYRAGTNPASAWYFPTMTVNISPLFMLLR